MLGAGRLCGTPIVEQRLNHVRELVSCVQELPMRLIRSLVLGMILTPLAIAQQPSAAQPSRDTSRSILTTIDHLARLEGQGETVLRGQGLVFGLNGTGDSGKDLAMARPLMEYYRNNGNPLGSIEDLKNTRNVAVVNVTATIPAGGARADDTITVSVQAIYGAKSLAGGELYLTALQGPYATGESANVFAIAQGRLTIEDPANQRIGIARGGARMIRDIITTPRIDSAFTLILKPEFASFAAASEIASRIRDEYNGRRARDASEVLPTVATVIDDRTIVVEIPDVERPSPAGFVGGVMRTTVNPALLGLPARVIANQTAGIILVTGDVEISPVAITQRELSITTTVPESLPTPENPSIRTDRWTTMGTGARPGERAKLNDLIEAFNHLKIPVSEQIAILTMLERAGKLHAQLILQ